jgi:hypothetical protein
MNETATYKGHKAVKYGRSSLVVYRDDHEVFHTGRRNEEACKDLKAWLVEFVDKDHCLVVPTPKPRE